MFDTMKPFWVDGNFGWYGAGRNNRGVVLCGTFGYEQHTVHRWWRDLSEGIAAAGCAVARFDYPGEGDSEDTPVRLASACDAIRGAVRVLRDEAKAEEIVLVGLRFGATLAALVAAEGGVDRLVLLAPFTRGRAYLREMEMQARLVDIEPDGTPLVKRPGLLSVGGFSVNADLKEDVAQIDLCRAERPPAPRILLLGPDLAHLAAKFTQQGSRAEAGEFPRLGCLLTDAHQSSMPEATRTRILNFVSEDAAERPGRSLCPPAAGTTMTGAGWSEAPLRFGNGLFGIRCQPPAVLPRTPAVLFVNLGAFVHSGHGRHTTTLARTLARFGVTSLRMDLRGVGDSADRPDGESPLYKLDAVDDLRAAIDVLTEDTARPVIVVGACNGAYLAFHAICQDPRITAAVLINLYCFDWELTHGGESYGAKPARHISAYAAMLLKWGTWRRLLTGAAPVGKIVRSLARRSTARLIDKFVKPAGSNERSRSISARIADVRRRGARLVVIYSAGDLGLVDLRTQLGSLDEAAAILGEPVRVIADADHAFSAEPAQAALLHELRNLTAPRLAEYQTSEQSNPSSAGRMSIALQGPLRTA